MTTAYTRTDDIWAQQLADIRMAKLSVFFEQYIVESFENNEVGTHFIEALIERARAGVTVRCIFDAQGSFTLLTNSDLADRLEKAGVKVFFYKTIENFRKHNPIRLMLRDHRKFLIIDNEITWIGGAVIGERFRGWLDLMMRYTNLDVAEVASKEFKRQILRLQDKRSLLAPLERVNSTYHFSGNAPGINNRFCYEEMCHAIMLAKTSVVMVTPYFAPPYKLFRILRRRLQEGLSITLITPKKSDHPLADLVRERYLYILFGFGLKVEYVNSMIHAKIVLTDTDWVTFGSANIDALSLIFNHELNIVSTDNETLQEVISAIELYKSSATSTSIEQSTYPYFSPHKKLLANVARFFV